MNEMYYQEIEGSSLKVFAKSVFDQLMAQAMEPCDINPQILEDRKNSRTFVVLSDDDFNTLEVQQPEEEYLFFLDMPRKNVSARAVVHDDGGITVLRGSTVGEEVQSMDDKYRETRKRLIDTGVIGFADGRLMFLKSCELANRSEAACIVSGDSKSGNEIWKDRNGKTLAERGMGRHR